jgi:hypothetical protein
MGSKIDLHGIRHRDVDRLVENFIFMNQDRVPLEIITGNSQKMIDLVSDVMNRHGIAQWSMHQYGRIVIFKL